MLKSSDDHGDELHLDKEREIAEIYKRLEEQKQLLQSILSTNHEILSVVSAKGCQEPTSCPWMPHEHIDFPDISNLSKQVRAIRFERQGEINIYALLVATRAAWFYRRYLKRFPALRSAVINVWGLLIPLLLRKINQAFPQRFNKLSHRLVPLRDYASRSPDQVFTLIDSQPISPISPSVYPVEDKCVLQSGLENRSYPDIYVTTIEDGIIYGATNLVFKDDEVICHDLYDCVSDSTSEELHLRAMINAGSNRICWLRNDPFPEVLEVAATFVDACSANYSHWLTEVLPRIELFVNDARFKEVPVIVNEGLHPNLMKSLFLVVHDGRKIYTLQKDKSARVRKLHVVSVTGYVPFDQRSVPGRIHSHGRFSPAALNSLKASFVQLLDQIPQQAWPTNLYLRRKGNIRQLVNQPDIERMLLSQGFVVIDTDKLSFIEQLALFNHAKCIVAPTGASLANAIWARHEARVIILMAKHEKMIYRYWAEMLGPLKLNISYVLGKIVQNKSHGIHGDFRVSESDLLEAISN